MKTLTTILLVVGVFIIGLVFGVRLGFEPGGTVVAGADSLRVTYLRGFIVQGVTLAPGEKMHTPGTMIYVKPAAPGMDWHRIDQGDPRVSPKESTE